MKKITNLLVMLLGVAALVGCGDKTIELSTTHKQIVGSWHLVEWAGSAADAEAATLADNGVDGELLEHLDVWIRFNDNATFEIYQKGMPYIYYTRYAGNCLVVDDVLNGTYSDGKEMGSSYDVEVSEDGKTLTLTKVDMSSDVSVYERVSEIPSEVTDGAQSMTTRGEEVYNFTRFL
ncbi:MAG: hypothetical protein IJ348_04505 [Alistipes sp.]|nr:hypothetical protein [Alistipes sp.]